MTPREYRLWKQETARSRTRWMVDPVQLHNRGDIVAYKGGVSGQFVWISASGEATMGNYDGAIPHIMEAVFKPIHKRQFTSREEAIEKVLTGLKDEQLTEEVNKSVTAYA